MSRYYPYRSGELPPLESRVSNTACSLICHFRILIFQMELQFGSLKHVLHKSICCDLYNLVGSSVQTSGRHLASRERVSLDGGQGEEGATGPTATQPV